MQSDTQKSLQLLQQHQHLLHSRSTSPSTAPWPALRVRTSFMPEGRYSFCNPRCRCCCHINHHICLPSLLYPVMGALFVGYSGLPRTFQHCSVRSCTARSNFQASINYVFPPWLIWKALISILVQSLSNGIQTSLVVKCRRPVSSLIFHYASNDNVAGLKRLFDSRQARPSDVVEGGGQNVIMVSYYHLLSVCVISLSHSGRRLMKHLKDTPDVISSSSL